MPVAPAFFVVAALGVAFIKHNVIEIGEIIERLYLLRRVSFGHIKSVRVKYLDKTICRGL